MTKWLEGNGTDSDIVVSSRIRLARNLEDIKFSPMMSQKEADKVTDMIKDSVLESNTILSKDFQFFGVENISPLDRKILVEKHIISPALLKRPEYSGFLLRDDEKVSIMINEEDHVRMQVIFPGFELNKAWDLADKIDDVLEENLKYAFDEQFGYITSCPTNVGTGLRASVMLHLPALVMTRYINKVLQAVSQMGLTVRGLYGEGTDVMGNLFQISNQTTIGETEDEIIEKLKRIVSQIVNGERESRDRLLSNKKIEIEDKVFRSYGVLTNSRILSSKESMKLLSNVKMGVDMGIIKDIDPNSLNKLMIITQPANIQKYAGESLNGQDRDIKRAELIRDKIIG
ncbi:protein arginine kinase [Dethiothermospora halolimnae]|uniref:protein arginine kinase n=1 Tax=Dethiothermospora halolimnae TaxID=3114390 RepID=UPI003CCBA186